MFQMKYIFLDEHMVFPFSVFLFVCLNWIKITVCDWYIVSFKHRQLCLFSLVPTNLLFFYPYDVFFDFFSGWIMVNHQWIFVFYSFKIHVWFFLWEFQFFSLLCLHKITCIELNEIWSPFFTHTHAYICVT